MVTEIHFNDILDQFDPEDPDYFEKAVLELARVSESTPDSIIILDIGRTFGITLEEGKSLRLHTTQGEVDLVKGQGHMIENIRDFRGMSFVDTVQYEDSTASHAIDKQGIKL